MLVSSIVIKTWLAFLGSALNSQLLTFSLSFCEAPNLIIYSLLLLCLACLPCSIYTAKLSKYLYGWCLVALASVGRLFSLWNRAGDWPPSLTPCPGGWLLVVSPSDWWRVWNADRQTEHLIQSLPAPNTLQTLAFRFEIGEGDCPMASSTIITSAIERGGCLLPACLRS